MLSRPLALVAAIAILASLFLPWLSSPFGENVVPWTVLRDLDAAGAQALLADARPETIAYGCSFVMAALFVLFALIGRESRLLAFLTGALPVALVAWAVLTVLRHPDVAGVSLSGSSVPDIASRMLGSGAWVWVLGASTLATLGVVDPGKGRVRFY
ncbi:MAG: hypothetical protein ACKO2N_16380 [Tabrizicola sp.]